ncbi:MAG: membrane dipeptidase [Gemmatimonadetes bacterium]|nr:membrane dipeptidase [Gemmatimonadota bacterium]
MRNANVVARIVRPIGLFSLLTVAACSGEPAVESEADLVARARGIHERVITLDTHNDINASNFTAERNYTTDLGTQVNLPNMEAGGLDVSWMVVYVGQGPLTEEGYANAHAQAIAKFDAIHRLTDEIAPDRIGLALTSDDARSIVASGRKVAMIGVENAYPLGTDLDNIRDFAERGGRYMSLAHNGHSQFSDSNTGERDDVWLHGGLSDLGRQAIAEMNKWGIMIDVSHPSKVANLQAMELSRAPVVASHSGARALGDVSRNMDDEQLLALKENGGVIQTVAFRSYLRPDKNAAYNEASQAIIADVAEEMGFDLPSGGRGAMRRATQAMSPDDREAFMAEYQRVQDAAASRIAAEVDPVTPPVGVSDLVDHIDYLVALIGLEHVGISSDFDGGGGVSGWNSAAETFNVTLELVRRGYTEDEIGMIWSGNLFRVLDEVQRVAAEIQAGG